MDYKYIRAWGRNMNSSAHYIANDIEEARKDKAPQNAIYRNDDGTWSTFDEIASQYTKDLVQALVE